MFSNILENEQQHTSAPSASRGLFSPRTATRGLIAAVSPSPSVGENASFTHSFSPGT